MAESIQSIHRRIYTDPNPDTYLQPHPFDLLTRPGARRNSSYTGDTGLGDTGKGITIAEQNGLMVVRFGRVFSIRANGGSNAGHHMWMSVNGRPVEFLANQLPAGVSQKGCEAWTSRACVFNPGDALAEIARNERLFGGSMPGQYFVDERVPLSLDTHRALDINDGSTGRGIGPAYGDFYQRKDVTLKDLMGEHWGRDMRRHYREKRAIIEATMKKELKKMGAKSAREVLVKRLDNSRVPLGNESEFLDRLSEDRKGIAPYVRSDAKERYQEVWDNEDLPVTIEEGQGPGLDPYAGIRGDVTSSRPSSRNIHDGTYGVVQGEDIALRIGVLKIDHMSSVGSRWLPGQMPEDLSDYFQKVHGEVGKTTLRLRDCYYLALPMIQSWRRTAAYNALVVGYLDSPVEDQPIPVTASYTDRRTGKPAVFLPYQDRVNDLVPEYVEMPGWNGQEAAKAKTPSDLPLNSRLALAFVSEVLDAPVVMARNGKFVGNNIRW